MKKINIILGKFQPWTRAHQQIIEDLYKQNNCKVLIIQTQIKNKDEKHPFNCETIRDEIRGLKNKKPIYDIWTHTGGDFGPLFQKLFDNNLIVKLWGCGTDRVEAYLKFIKNVNYQARFHIPEDLEIYEIKRTDQDISATKLREAIKNNDFETFSKMMPDMICQTNIEYFYKIFLQELQMLDN